MKNIAIGILIALLLASLYGLFKTRSHMDGQSERIGYYEAAIDSLEGLVSLRADTISRLYRNREYYKSLYVKTLYELDDKRRELDGRAAAVRAAYGTEALKWFDSLTD